MIFRDLNFLNPHALYVLLVLLPILGFAQYYYLYRKRILKTFQSNATYPLYWVKVILLLATWTFATFALMGPAEHGSYPEELKKAGKVTRKVHNVIFALDASASMSATDTPSKTTRLAQAKEIADEIAKKLSSENVALYAFTSQPTKLVPLTLNALFLRLQLQTVQVNEGGVAGTKFQPLFEQISKETLGAKTVILLSDGENNGKEPTPLKNTRLVTIGVGSKQGQTLNFAGQEVHTSLNEELLKKLSRENHGRFFDANVLTPLRISDQVKKFVEEKAGEEVIEETPPAPYTLYFQVPLALALLCLGLSMLLPERIIQRQVLESL